MDAIATKPFELINADSRAAVVLICDHASRSVPVDLDNLGLTEEHIRRHIGWDIGAGEVTRALARELGAPAILAGFSRLIIDPNREPCHPDSIRGLSDGIVVPGNQSVDRGEAARRARLLYHPYHQAIERALRHAATETVPVLISVHSFTPVMDAVARPWHAALLHGDDARLVAPVQAAFTALYPDLTIGDNEPYTGYSHHSYSVLHHAERHGLPNITFEIRQDLIDSPAGTGLWTGILRDVLAGPLAEESLRHIWERA